MDSKIIEKFKKYKEEIEEDLKINDINLSDKAFNVPHKKHYWCSVYIKESQELMKMQKNKAKIEKELTKNKQTDSPIQFSQKSIKNLIAETDTMQNLKNEIDEQQLLVQYLKDVQSIFTYITNDIKNIIELKQLELS